MLYIPQNTQEWIQFAVLAGLLMCIGIGLTLHIYFGKEDENDFWL